MEDTVSTIRKRVAESEEKMHEAFDSVTGSEKKSSFMKMVMKVTACSTAGLLFGIATEKGRVFEPLAIQEQMTMDRFLMVKMFLSAVSSGIFSMSLLSMIPATKKTFEKTSQNFAACFTDKGVLSVGLGAALLGTGMSISGSCPGMVLVQVGAKVPNALYTFSGALTAAFVYGLVEPTVVHLTRSKEPLRHQFFHKYLASPYFIVALPLGAALSVIVFGLELFAPWKSELAKNVAESGGSILTRTAWPPYIAGAVIGFLQVPIILTVDDTLGSTSSFCTIVSQLLVINPLKKLSPYLCKFQSGFSNWWQVFYIGGAIAGAYVSALASDTIGQVEGVSASAAFVGGFLMVFGSRLAAGCTSGHGLSGMGLLSLLSFVAVPSMFVGGIVTAVFMKIF